MLSAPWPLYDTGCSLSSHLYQYPPRINLDLFQLLLSAPPLPVPVLSIQRHMPKSRIVVCRLYTYAPAWCFISSTLSLVWIIRVPPACPLARPPLICGQAMVAPTTLIRNLFPSHGLHLFLFTFIYVYSFTFILTPSAFPLF